MGDICLTIQELEDINEGVKAYIDAVKQSEYDNINFVGQIATAGGERFFNISLIMDIINKRISFWIVDMSEIGYDDYLDAYNNTFNQKS